MSVIVEKANSFRCCNSCNSAKGVVEITTLMRVGNTEQGSQIALCESCAQMLRFALNSRYKGCGEPMNDLISRQEAKSKKVYSHERHEYVVPVAYIDWLPSAQPEIIRCKDCKHWTQSTGKMKGYGLGRCDFHDADLVTCNGFCYWAEGRTDE